MFRIASIALSAILLTAVSVRAQSGPGAVAPTAADQKLGMALMWASIRSDGGVADGEGTVSSSRVAMGQYQVIFERTLSGCGFTASATLANIVAAVENTGFVVPNSVTVSLTLNGNYVDHSSRVTVICTR